MGSQKAGELRARSDGSLLMLRCGVSAVALTTFAIATPAWAQSDQPAPADVSLQPAADAQGGAQAGDTAAQDDDAIVITGIRASLRRSQDIKRDSDVVVDSVTAEDIGALPDRSVTEALQRIPGVAIDRFDAGRDPDHFSTEGSGVVVRGLTYVRSELNGRDTFTANNGRGLSFSDVPAELLGGVDVFKSPSAEMIEGGISGIVNLRTRLPLDGRRGFTIAGSLEANYGDFREEWSPSGSILASGRWDTPAGEFGLLASFSYSQLKWRNDGIQISDFGRRTLYSNGDVIQSGTATPVGEVFLPRGAVMRTQETDRTRYGYAAAAQWRSPNRDITATLQFLRSDSREAWTEHTIEIATDNVTSAGDSRAVPGTTLSFDEDGVFDNGFITGPQGWRGDQNDGQARTPVFGLQSNNQRRDRRDRFITSDYGANVRWDVNDRLSFNFDYQHVDSSVSILDTTLWTSAFQDAFIDLNGSSLPTVEFRPPQVCSPAPPAGTTSCTGAAGSSGSPLYFGQDQNGVVHNSYADPFNTFYRSAMDHIEESRGNEDAFRIDGELTFADSGWLDSVRVGYRYADRENLARFSQYNWGVLSEIWGGGGPVWLDDPVDGVTGGTGGTPPGGYEVFGFDGFLRGQVGNPTLGDPRLYYGSNTAEGYQALIDYATRIRQEWTAGPSTSGASGWVPLAQRPGVVAGTPFLPGEINPVSETNNAAYAMLRFSNEFSNGWRLSGNVGVRYTHTERVSDGNQVFNQGNFTSEADCLAQPDPTPFCELPLAVRDAARAWANGALTPSSVRLDYDYFLPSLNLKLETGHGLQFRFAWSNTIAPPQFGLTRNYYNLSLATNTQDIEAGGGQPVARATVGNPLLRPTESTNFDFSAEWYFSDVGQLTFAAFYKRLTNVVSNGTARIPFTNNGATFDAIVTTPDNSEDAGTIRGFEIGYQQVFSFLPGWLRGFGLSATYTYVDSSGVRQSTLSETDADVAAGNQANVDTSLLPLQGLSRHTVNITPFFELGPVSVRLAYNWRSRFLLTTRDVIVPFAPIFNESTGQLDGSIFFSINEHLKLGVQAVNILNEVTRTSSVLEASPGRILTGPRGWFMNDRRFSFIVRANF